MGINYSSKMRFIFFGDMLSARGVERRLFFALLKFGWLGHPFLVHVFQSTCSTIDDVRLYISYSAIRWFCYLTIGTVSYDASSDHLLPASPIFSHLSQWISPFSNLQAIGSVGYASVLAELGQSWYTCPPMLISKISTDLVRVRPLYTHLAPTHPASTRPSTHRFPKPSSTQIKNSYPFLRPTRQ